MYKIREALKESRIRQTELSIPLGKSYNTVSHHVVNNHQTSLPTLLQIAEILDIDVRDLLVPNKK